MIVNQSIIYKDDNLKINSNKDNIVKNEIDSGKKEQAATATFGVRQRKVFIFPLLKWKQKLVILLSLLLLVSIISVGVVAKIGFFAHSNTKEDSVTIVEGVQDLATLATAEAMVTTIMEQEDNKLFGQDISVNIPGTKRTVFLVVPATVIAGVDLQSLTAKNIQLDEKSKKVTIMIPHAKVIQDPSIQFDKIKTFSNEGIFRSHVDWKEGYKFVSEAKKQIIQEANELGLLDKADKSAVKVLTNFLTTLGYDANVEFE